MVSQGIAYLIFGIRMGKTVLETLKLSCVAQSLIKLQKPADGKSFIRQPLQDTLDKITVMYAVIHYLHNHSSVVTHYSLHLKYILERNLFR